MKKLFMIAALLLATGCGSVSDDPRTLPIPARFSGWENIPVQEGELPTKASFDYSEECSWNVEQVEVIDQSTDSIEAGGITLTYRYDTVDGRFYLSLEGDVLRSLQFFDKAGYVRAGILCK